MLLQIEDKIDWNYLVRNLPWLLLVLAGLLFLYKQLWPWIKELIEKIRLSWEAERKERKDEREASQNAFLRSLTERDQMQRETTKLIVDRLDALTKAINEPRK